MTGDGPQEAPTFAEERNMTHNATTLDTIHIEVPGESRAVTRLGNQWVGAVEQLPKLIDEVESALARLTQLDVYTETFGNSRDIEDATRDCRDRLRKAAIDARNVLTIRSL